MFIPGDNRLVCYLCGCPFSFFSAHNSIILYLKKTETWVTQSANFITDLLNLICKSTTGKRSIAQVFQVLFIAVTPLRKGLLKRLGLSFIGIR